MTPEALARLNAHRRANGEFGNQPHSDPEHDVPASGTPMTTPEILAQRIEQLRETGYVSAGAVPDMFDPSTTKRIDAWWQSSFALTEQARGGGHHLMPDDYTPGMGAGRSLGGNRRTHRMKYEGAGVTLRMPSVTSVKRYSKDIKGATFDIPVEASTPAGNVQGFVRVTPGANGSWEVEALGLEGQPQIAGYLSESVRATLEGRRPSMALKEVADLAERRRERLIAEGARMYEPKQKSSVVKAVGYSREAGEMYVQLGRRHYAYAGVDPREAGILYRGVSPGKSYNERVKGKYPSLAASECGECGRVTSTATEHQCPGAHEKAARTMKFERLAIQRALGARKHRSFERALERAMEERPNWSPVDAALGLLRARRAPDRA